MPGVVANYPDPTNYGKTGYHDYADKIRGNILTPIVAGSTTVQIDAATAAKLDTVGVTGDFVMDFGDVEQIYILSRVGQVCNFTAAERSFGSPITPSVNHLINAKFELVMNATGARRIVAELKALIEDTPNFMRIDGGNSALDSTFRIADETDDTKKISFSVGDKAKGVVGTISTAFTTAKTVNIPDIAGTFIMDAGAQTITGVKTFTGVPVLITSTGGAPAELQLRAGSFANKVGAIAWFDPSDSDRRFARITAEREAGNSLSDLNFYVLINPHSASGFQVENALQIRGNDTLGGRGQLYVGNAAYRTFFDLNIEREQNIISVGVVTSKSLRAHAGNPTREAEGRFDSAYYSAAVYVGSTITAPLDDGNADTGSIAVADATGWPAGNALYVFNEGTADEETVWVSSRTGTTLSGLYRDVAGTGIKSHLTGATVKPLGIHSDTRATVRHAFITASPLVTKWSLLFDGIERFSIRSTDGAILTPLVVSRTSGTLLSLMTTDADSVAEIILGNDAQTWHIQTAGGAGDRFQIFNGSGSAFSIEVGTPDDTFRLFANGRVSMKSGTAFNAEIFHTNTGDHAYKFPDLTGTFALLQNDLGEFASTTSAQLASTISDETGSGALVFAISPTLVTPTLGAALATSINGLTLTASTGVLSIADGKTFTVSRTLTFTGTDGQTFTFPATSDTVAVLGIAQTFTQIQTVQVAAGGQLVKVISTAADTSATIRFQNDALSWEIGVKGNAGDRFSIENPGTGVSPFNIQSGAPADCLQLLSTGRIQWKSGTAQNGIFTHANTATRTYTFQDFDYAVAGLGVIQSWGAAQTFTGGVTITTADLTITDRNVVLSATTGTKFGTATTQKLSLWGVTPITQPSAYTQTYSTADKTLGAYTSDPESSAYTGINNLQGGTPYAQVSELNNLRVAYENLRVLTEDAVAMLNSVVDDLQAIGAVG